MSLLNDFCVQVLGVMAWLRWSSAVSLGILSTTVTSRVRLSFCPWCGVRGNKTVILAKEEAERVRELYPRREKVLGDYTHSKKVLGVIQLHVFLYHAAETAVQKLVTMQPI